MNSTSSGRFLQYSVGKPKVANRSFNKLSVNVLTSEGVSYDGLFIREYVVENVAIWSWNTIKKLRNMKGKRKCMKYSHRVSLQNLCRNNTILLYEIKQK